MQTDKLIRFVGETAEKYVQTENIDTKEYPPAKKIKLDRYAIPPNATQRQIQTENKNTKKYPPAKKIILDRYTIPPNATQREIKQIKNNLKQYQYYWRRRLQNKGGQNYPVQNNSRQSESKGKKKTAKQRTVVEMLTQNNTRVHTSGVAYHTRFKTKQQNEQLRSKREDMVSSSEEDEQEVVKKY